MSRDWYCIHVSLELLDRLKDLQKKYKSYFDTVDDLAEYILDNWSF